MKIITENLIVSIRILTGAFGMFIFVLIGVMMDADPMLLILGGLLFASACYVAGMALANIMTQILKESELRPIDREEEEKMKHNKGKVDFFQDMELPRMD